MERNTHSSEAEGEQRGDPMGAWETALEVRLQGMTCVLRVYGTVSRIHEMASGHAVRTGLKTETKGGEMFSLGQRSRS